MVIEIGSIHLPNRVGKYIPQVLVFGVREFHQERECFLHICLVEIGYTRADPIDYGLVADTVTVHHGEQMLNSWLHHIIRFLAGPRYALLEANELQVHFVLLGKLDLHEQLGKQVVNKRSTQVSHRVPGTFLRDGGKRACTILE